MEIYQCHRDALPERLQLLAMQARLVAELEEIARGSGDPEHEAKAAAELGALWDACAELDRELVTGEIVAGECPEHLATVHALERRDAS